MHRHQILSRGLRRQRGEMNKTEAKYAEILAADPNVSRWWFEPLSLQLSHPEAGQPARYSPDFLVLMSDGTTYVDEVKPSGNFDDRASIVRLKCAAELYPLWVFRIIRARLKRDGGGFDVTEV